MRITLFGAGFVGAALAGEFAGRGHEVTAVARRSGGDVHDPAAVTAAVREADVIVSALPPLDDQGGLPASTRILIDAALAAGARLGVVGSSAILPVSTGGPRHADTPDFPAFLADRVDAHDRTLARLRSAPAGLDWFYLAAAGEFGQFAPGTRTGHYRSSTTSQVQDGSGRSRIGVADYAIAFADELEKPTVHRGWLTVAY
ncbi:NAD(P)H-binding protein [Actinoplanes sp. LDG1-06]|uniref:NAD(P)H-binding protein n=1 Tax=Paractinoplanes ovalisporus TaxID=2810368 RepID=A0ABS2ANS6_9ACTN|nr:NAD(P)H-binding protein [Actinoplanes ovalisporus]MBM2620854.1 NAD(P)H-binding protein [Actinoplanes ovalisporus]